MVEAAFGTFGPFNAIVRAMLSQKIDESDAARAHVKRLRRAGRFSQLITSMRRAKRPVLIGPRASVHRCDTPHVDVPPMVPPTPRALEAADEAI